MKKGGESTKSTPPLIEPASNNQTQPPLKGAQLDGPDPNGEPTTTPKQSNQVAVEGASHTSGNQDEMRIEGHPLSAKDHASRAHILYSLPNLNSLPKRSSSAASYLKVSQRNIYRGPASPTEIAVEEGEIQSRIRSAEKRIALVPIKLYNRFQVL